MITAIKAALTEIGINTWIVNEERTHSAELFFIKHTLDTRRLKDTCKYKVSVYRDFEKDGKQMRGMSSVEFVPSQTNDEILEGLQGAYFAAAFVENPTYELPAKQTCDKIVKDGFFGLSAEDAALKAAAAIFDADIGKEAFLNTAEVFAVKKDIRLLSSSGSDVSFTLNEINGEIVAQCKQPQDVEIFDTFVYEELNEAALKEKTAVALKRAEDRAKALPELPTGEYNLILSEKTVAEVLSYFVSRSNVGMIYPKYSVWKIGDFVQNEPAEGEKLNITLHAAAPFSEECIAMSDKALIKDGCVSLFHGGARLSAYLGVEPTGIYNSFCCDNGTVAFADMKNEPYLYPVVFSDFQMDEMSGHFGGEIRLAYYYDGKETRLVTGGSVNGSINECSGNLIFSKERYSEANYSGPFAVKLKGVKAAGSLSE